MSSYRGFFEHSQAKQIITITVADDVMFGNGLTIKTSFKQPTTGWQIKWIENNSKSNATGKLLTLGR